ncbi:glucuronate isomerase [Paenibacillus hodogayensis]|uniref:Glucuronate isomerase n=1 Tax=Paenibacillus hodogayensis TaxID=279208 RepID=A0ABV5W8K4_9BACL
MNNLTRESLPEAIRQIVHQQPITDMHTHLYPPEFGGLMLRGIDELLTYHYLVAEVMRWSDMSIEQFWMLNKQEQAEHIWQKLFLEHSPVSEACRGVLTSIQAMGMDMKSRDLNQYRQFCAALSAEEHINLLLQRSNVEHVVMTNDVFSTEERNVWLSGKSIDSRFHAVLRLDPLLNDYSRTKSLLQGWGYQVEEEWSEISQAEVRRFLLDWIDRMNPLYVAVSLPSTFVFPDDSDRSRLIADCLLPVCRERDLPFALMIGVKNKVHPALGDAGYYVGKAETGALEHLLMRYPYNKFFVTMLSRENQHELTVLARKFRNLMVFGCWWFLNNPVLIGEMTRMRLELLGTSVIPQHSDARVFDQLLYKWSHSKQIISDVLIEKYSDIADTGWQLEREEIERDVADLLHNNFWNFLSKKLR